MRSQHWFPNGTTSPENICWDLFSQGHKANYTGHIDKFGWNYEITMWFCTIFCWMKFCCVAVPGKDWYSWLICPLEDVNITYDVTRTQWVEEQNTKTLLQIHPCLLQSFAKPRFPCITCGRTFTKKCNLYRHHRDTHQKSPRFVCSECNQTFVRRYVWKNHMEIHHS